MKFFILLIDYFIKQTFRKSLNKKKVFVLSLTRSKHTDRKFSSNSRDLNRFESVSSIRLTAES